MHKQLTFEERVQIEEFLGQQRSQGEIARTLERSESTIRRELSRHRVNGVDVAKRAQSESEQRRRERPVTRKMDRPEIRDAVQRRTDPVRGSRRNCRAASRAVAPATGTSHFGQFG